MKPVFGAVWCASAVSFSRGRGVGDVDRRIDLKKECFAYEVSGPHGKVTRGARAHSNSATNRDRFHNAEESTFRFQGGSETWKPKLRGWPGKSCGKRMSIERRRNESLNSHGSPASGIVHGLLYVSLAIAHLGSG